MTIVGHWSSLTEAQKLVQSQLLAGVVEEVIEEGNLIPKIPVFQINAKSVKYNREKTLPSADFYDINQPIPWTADVDYTAQKEVELKRVLRQDVLDKFMRDTYQNPNDYRAIVLAGLGKGCARTIEDKMIYGDLTYNSAKEFDGLHAFAAENDVVAGTADGVMDIDEGDTVLSLMNMRLLLDGVKAPQLGTGNMFWLMPHILARRIDAHVQEAGIASYAGPYNIMFGINDLGKRVTMFDGVPIVRSDFMVAEQLDTGRGSNARAKWSSGHVAYSIFLIRTGQIMEGGLCMAFGGSDGGNLGEFFAFEDFEKLENYDAEGMRLKAYVALALGSSKSLGRIHDIIDGAVTA